MKLYRIYNPVTKKYYMSGHKWSHWQDIGEFYASEKEVKNTLQTAMSMAKPHRKYDYTNHKWLEPTDSFPCLQVVVTEVNDIQSVPFYDYVSPAMKKKYISLMDPRDIVQTKPKEEVV